MKFLVTGGAGFIGSNLTHFLLQQGQSVVVFDDLSTGKADNLADILDKIEFVQGDVRDKSAVSRAMTGCKGVFHLATMASVQKSIDHPEDAHAINVGGTLNVLESMKTHGIRRVVLAASAAAGMFANGQNEILCIASFAVMCAVWLVTSLLAGFLKQWLFLFFATLYFVLPQILILPPVGDATASMSETQYFISDILRYIWESPMDAVFPYFDCMIVSYVMLAVCGAVFLAGLRLRKAAKHSELYCRTRLELMD